MYRATRWALSPKDWLRSRLTGQFATEPSDASATLLYDLVNDSWDLEVLDVLGLDPAKLPPVLGSSGQPAGELTAAAARDSSVSPRASPSPPEPPTPRRRRSAPDSSTPPPLS